MALSLDIKSGVKAKALQSFARANAKLNAIDFEKPG